MEVSEVIELIRLYIGMYSNGTITKVDGIEDILKGIEENKTFESIVEYYDLL